MNTLRALSLAFLVAALSALPSACASCKGAPAPVEPTPAAAPASDAGPAPTVDNPATAK
ncbi:MAG: hypothetical protein PHU25_03940 [Deltaproteobacteria bacterium]|nr:hypothetical protein [Deltaproteobacteria bacterium]